MPVAPRARYGNGNGNGNGNGRSTVPWQTIVMVMAAFIVGLLPFLVAQRQYVTKDEVTFIRDQQLDILQRLTNLEAKIGQIEENTAAIGVLQSQVATLTAQLQSILPGAGSSSDSGVIPGGGPSTVP